MQVNAENMTAYFKAVKDNLNPVNGFTSPKELLSQMTFVWENGFQERFKENLQGGVRFNLGTGEFGLGEINSEADKAMKAALRGLAERYGSLFPAIAAAASGTASPSSSGAPGFAMSSGSGKPDATTLEKMGFVFSGGSQADYAKETAANTRKIVTWQQKLYEAYAGRRDLALVNS